MTIIDLTHWISPNGSIYPGDPKPVIDVTPARFDQDGKLKSAVTELRIRPHHGTHIDAPAHKIPGGKTIEIYPVEKFINDALLLDMMEFVDEARADAFRRDDGSRYVRTVTKDYIKRSLEGRYNGQRAVVIRTGYDKIIERGVQDDMNFPFLDPDAASYLAMLGLNIVGIDSFSVDPKGSTISPAHIALLERDCLIAETLVNLYVLKAAAERGGFMLYAPPIIIEGSDAAPARVYAEVGI